MNEEVKKVIPHPIVTENQRGNQSTKKGVDTMASKDDLVTQKEFDLFKDSIDLRIKASIGPLEEKINNLPTQFENMLYKEREYQEEKRKETNRFVLGTVILGIIGIVVSIFF